MSESKARLTSEAQTLRQNRDELFGQLTRLMAYVHDMQVEYPDINWPEMPDRYSETLWRRAL